MTAKQVLNLLDDTLVDHYYQVRNTYIFGKDWESDWFSISPQNLVYEVEVKVNNMDFHADFKKRRRHEVLQSSSGLNSRNCPNKFFFCAPESKIHITEVPHYAGLMLIIDGKVEIVKEAPLLHEDKSSLADILLDKFYYQNRNLVHKMRSMSQDLEFYQSEKYHQNLFKRLKANWA